MAGPDTGYCRQVLCGTAINSIYAEDRQLDRRCIWAFTVVYSHEIEEGTTYPLVQLRFEGVAGGAGFPAYSVPLVNRGWLAATWQRPPQCPTTTLTT